MRNLKYGRYVSGGREREVGEYQEKEGIMSEIEASTKPCTR